MEVFESSGRGKGQEKERGVPFQYASTVKTNGVTIAHVAERAGVSQATVSRVLNNHPHVSPRTRRKVEAAMAELDYQPSKIASALTTKQTNTLGLILPDVSSPFYAEIARAVESAADGLDYHIVMCNTEEDPQREARHLALLRQKGVDGFIVAPASNEPAYLKMLVESGFPICLVARDAPTLSVDCVIVDDFKGGYLATRYLLELGHTRIATISGPTHVQVSVNRVQGYRQALAEFGVQRHEAIVEAKNFSLEAGLEAGRLLLERFDRRSFPTAVFAANDLLAIGLLYELRRAGLTVPGDVSVIGFDGTVLASVVDPPLTTMVQPTREMGRLAVETVQELVAGKRHGARRMILEPELRQGASTRALTTP